MRKQLDRGCIYKIAIDTDTIDPQDSMKHINLVAALIFGLATPVLAQTIAPTIAVAQDRHPNGAFVDREWTVSVYYRDNTYRYYGYNNLNDSKIELSGATVSGDRQRRIYTWNNGGTRYRVTWKPQDPDFIRVQVKTPDGKQVLNRVLPRSQEGGM